MPSYPTRDPRNTKRLHGEFFYKLIVAGELEDAFKSFGNALSAQLQHTVTKEDLPDRVSGAGGKYVEEITEKEGQLTIRLTEHAVHVIRTALLGTLETVAAQNAAAAQTVDTPPAAGVHFLGRVFITVTGVAQGATPLVLGTDYRVVDANRGIVELLETGTTLDPDGADVTFTFNQADVDARTRIRAFVENQLELQLRFIDRSTRGPKQDYTFWRMSVEPGQIDMLAEGFAQFDLVLNILSDADGNYGGSAENPFYEIVEYPVETVGS